MKIRGDGISSGAEFSDDERFRYRLWRAWGSGPRALFIMLNPSTATESASDPTVKRCITYASDWGFYGLEVCNLFAYRATKPKDMLRQLDPVGPVNSDVIATIADRVVKTGGKIVCAWGPAGRHLGRSNSVTRMLRDQPVPLHYLTVTQNGEPGHPLYLRKDLLPVLWGSES